MGVMLAVRVAMIPSRRLVVSFLNLQLYLSTESREVLQSEK